MANMIIVKFYSDFPKSMESGILIKILFYGISCNNYNMHTIRHFLVGGDCCRLGKANL